MAMNILDAFASTPPPIDYVLPGMIAGTVGAIVSPGGAGKSMLVLEIGVLVTSGLDIIGLTEDQPQLPTGRVVYMAAEDPEIALRHRLHALGQHLPQDVRDLVHESLTIQPMLGKPCNLFDPGHAAKVEAEAVGTRLMVIDTLRRFHSGDENDGAQMAALLDVMEGITTRTGCSILFVHHANKAAAMAGQGDLQQASRGSSVLVDNIRWQMYLAGMSKDEAKSRAVDDDRRGYFVRMGVSKQNYGPPISEQWLRRAEGGVLVPAHVPLTSDMSPVAAPAKRSEKMVNGGKW